MVKTEPGIIDKLEGCAADRITGWRSASALRSRRLIVPSALAAEVPQGLKPIRSLPLIRRAKALRHPVCDSVVPFDFAQGRLCATRFAGPILIPVSGSAQTNSWASTNLRFIRNL